MVAPFIGSEAVAARALSAYTLRSRCTPLYPDVYLPSDAEVSAVTRAEAAWLWSRRRGVIAGRSAAALHGAKWVDSRRPAQILWSNRRAPAGVEVWSDAAADDELTTINWMRITKPARTALDIACRERFGSAIASIDSLARATRLKPGDVMELARRHDGRRGIRQARKVLEYVDPGAESPRETWLRLLFIRAGFPAPATQIPIRNEYGVVVASVDMGWEELKIAAEYDGDHHRMNRWQFNKDIHRAEVINDLGWIHLRVTAADAEGDILRRVRAAFARRT